MGIRNWLYNGQVFHARTHQVNHRFSYPTFFVKMPIDSLSGKQSGFFGVNAFGIFSVYAQDYLRGQRGDFETLVNEFLREQELSFKPVRIELQTNPRVLGYVFNPVSFWYLYKTQNELGGVLVEVNNTFGERHFYLLDYPAQGLSPEDEIRAQKVFHVSPFFGIEGFYKFRFELKDQYVKATINYWESETKIRLVTWISGTARSLDRKNVLMNLLKYGWMTGMVVIRIHIQALQLWIKKVTFFKKPTPPQQEVTK